MFSSNCCFLTCIQVSWETGKVVWFSQLFKNFPQYVVIETVKCSSIVNEAEIDVYLEFPYFFYDLTNVGNLISGSSAFSKSSLNIWKFTVHVLLKPGLGNFEHYFTSEWNECNCTVVWAFFVIAFLWDWNENWPFPVLWPLLSFPNLLAYWVQHFHSIIFQHHHMPLVTWELFSDEEVMEINFTTKSMKNYEYEVYDNMMRQILCTFIQVTQRDTVWKH